MLEQSIKLKSCTRLQGRPTYDTAQLCIITGRYPRSHLQTIMTSFVKKVLCNAERRQCKKESSSVHSLHAMWLSVCSMLWPVIYVADTTVTTTSDGVSSCACRRKSNPWTLLRGGVRAYTKACLLPRPLALSHGDRPLPLQPCVVHVNQSLRLREEHFLLPLLPPSVNTLQSYSLSIYQSLCQIGQNEITVQRLTYCPKSVLLF